MTRQVFKELPLRNAELERLLDEARKLPPMTSEEREEQRRSWAYGNCAIENPNVTREMVDEVADVLRPCPKCGFYLDTPNHELGCAPFQSDVDAHHALPSDKLGHHYGPVHPDIMPYTPVEKEPR